MSRGNTHDAFGPWQQVSLILKGKKILCWRSSNAENGKVLFITESCSSSLDLAWHLHQAELLPAFGSVLTLKQWAGRGRLGRTWHSPLGNIYAAWHLPMPDEAWNKILSLVAGYIILKGLNQWGIQAQLKWPNDLVVDGRKIGGILIEEKNNALMAGIGINLISSPSKAHLRDSHALYSASLKEYHIDASPVEFWQKLIEKGDTLYSNITRLKNFSDFIRKVQNHMAFIGDKIMVSDSQNSPYEARLIGLNSSGYLQVATSQKQLQVRSGSIYPITE